jgi:hypothetical protein
MVGFAEVNMADIHVIVLVIGMETCVNTQKLTELWVCIDTFETLGRLYDLFVTHLSSFVASK